MSKYLPPYTISDKMIGLVSSISEKIGNVTSHRTLDSKPQLRKNNRILSVHSSLKIEANSLSLDEVRDVINGRIVLGNMKEIQEVKNAYNAYEKISEIDPSSMDDIKRFHGIMTYRTVEESGQFRKGNEGVFSGDKCIFVCPPPEMVNSLMVDLLDWVKESDGKINPLIVAAVFHYEFVFIHPFSDGNGRMARLWHTAILYKWRNIFEYIPLESQIEKYQEEYYEAIAVSNKNGNSDFFIEFVLELIDQVLDEVIVQINVSDAGISKYVSKLLSNMEYDVPYTANELLQKLGLKSKETLRKNYIDPAIEQELIKMTIPEKPRSKNQRYVRK